jgi:hypothetical protein
VTILADVLVIGNKDLGTDWYDEGSNVNDNDKKNTNSGGNTLPFMSAAEILGYRPLSSLRPPSYYSFSTGGRIMLAFFGMHGHGLDYSTI